MKKTIFAITMALILILVMNSAFALTWINADPDQCEKYDIQIAKYEKVESDVGNAYRESASVTAKKGDTVYFTVKVTGEDGEPIDSASIELHDLTKSESVGGLDTALVTGNNPYIRVSVIEKTPIDKLYYKGKNVVVTDTNVTIGELTFVRDNGIIVDVDFDGNALEMREALEAMGMSLDDVYGRKLCMTDDLLIKNFGKYCKSEVYAYWNYQAATQFGKDVTIPKTGDTTVIFYALSAIFVATVCLRARYSHEV